MPTNLSDQLFAPVHKNFGLHTAAASGDVEAARFALQCGQPPDSILNGILPLHAACSSGNEEMVLLLLEYGAEINAGRLPATLGEAPGMGTIGSTALHFAAANGHTAIVRILLKRGACATVKDRDGMDPELLAVSNNHWATGSYIRAWVQKNADEAVRSSFDSQTIVSPPATSTSLRARGSFDHLSAAAAGVKSTIKSTKNSALSKISSNPNLKNTEPSKFGSKLTISTKHSHFRSNNGLLSPTFGSRESRVRKSSLPSLTHKRSNTCGSVPEPGSSPHLQHDLSARQASDRFTFARNDSSQSLAAAKAATGSKPKPRKKSLPDLSSSFLFLSDDDCDTDVSNRPQSGKHAFTEVNSGVQDDAREYLREQRISRPPLLRSQSGFSSRKVHRKPVTSDMDGSLFLSIPSTSGTATESPASAPSTNNFPFLSSTQYSLRSPTVSQRSRTTSTPSSISSRSFVQTSLLRAKTTQEHAQAILRAVEKGGSNVTLDSDGKPMTLGQMLAAYGEALEQERSAVTSTEKGRVINELTKASLAPKPECKRRSHSLAALSSMPPCHVSSTDRTTNPLSSPEGIDRGITNEQNSSTSSLDPDSSALERYMNVLDSSSFNELRPGDWYGDLSQLPGIPKNNSISRSYSTAGIHDDWSTQPSTPRSQTNAYKYSSPNYTIQDPPSPSQGRWGPWNVRKQKSVAIVALKREPALRFDVDRDGGRLRTQSGPLLERVTAEANIAFDLAGKGVLKTFIEGLKSGVAR